MSRRVAGNAAWNVAGTLVSSLVGFVALALLVDRLGVARMGVFTLALGLIGFSGLLDLGLGRAITQKLASDLGEGRPKATLAPLVWNTSTFLICVGLAAAITLWWVIPWAVASLFHLSGELASESIIGLRLVALSIPLALASTVAAGALEGMQEFRLVSTQRAALSILQFGLPVLAAFLRPDVGWAIGGLAISRVVATMVWSNSLRNHLPREPGAQVKRVDYLHLAKFGGWLSVSNVVGPLMVYADRFYLASLFPPAAVAYYAVPLDSLFRVTTLPATAMGAVLPAFAENRSDARSSVAMMHMAINVLVAVVLPFAFMGSLLASPALRLWLGPEFALNATVIFRWLVIGIFVNSAAHVPLSLVHGQGRADISAKLHLIELPVFAAILVGAVQQWGVVGAAIAWTMRVALDMVLLYAVAIRRHPGLAQVLVRGVPTILFGGLMLAVPLVTSIVMWRLFAAAGVVAVSTLSARRVYAAWRLRSVVA